MMSILLSPGDKDMVEITTLRNSLAGLKPSANSRLEDNLGIGNGLRAHSSDTPEVAIVKGLRPG